MKRRQSIVVCVLAALALAALALAALVLIVATLPQREPVYQGKTLTQWMSEASIGTWPRQGPVAADEAIRHIGTNGFPFIAKLLRAHDSALKARLLALYYKQSFIHINIASQNQRHNLALGALEALGPEAKPLLPEVAKALNHMDPYLRPATEFWLQSLGPDADGVVPALLTILKDKKSPTRFSEAQTLGKISWQRRGEVIPALTACCQDTNENQMVRFWAKEALKELGQPELATEAKAR